MNILSWLDKRRISLVAIGFLLGVLGFTTYRIVTYKTMRVHHHANFALYINGERDEFKSFTFYEEVQACADHGAANPKSRVHMHNQDASLIHVHDNGATWGHFFANLGYGLTDKALQNDDGVFAASDDDKLTFILNGQEVSTIANRVISSEDVLLINYGSEDNETLEQRFKEIPSNAQEFNGKNDPGGCAGNEAPSFIKRLEAALGIEEQH